ncbi:tetratricopeptide repeat protein [Pseudomonas sp.]|uniref:tetratricopeptide repeat protein n=1 Tax=Pseudomonas sp. TaxID=306 RepID=UPI003C728519
MRSLLIIFLIICSSASADTTELIENAKKEISNTKYPEAIELLEKARSESQSEQEKVKIDNAIGWTYFLMGDAVKSERILLEAHAKAKELGDNKASIIISNNLGIIYYSTGQLQKSSENFNHPESRDSETANKYTQLIDKGNREALANEHITQGALYRAKMDFSSAVNQYELALTEDPYNARAWEYKGYALYRLGQFNDSITSSQKALEIESNNLNSMINIFKAACALKNGSEIEKHWISLKDSMTSNANIVKADIELTRACSSYSNIIFKE